jgi:hypothetical protein
MPFIEHFELLSLVHFDVVETWAARESGSERKLLLHRYPKASGLRERLQAMPLTDLARILKAGEDGDYFFVVTKDAPEFRRFIEWVDKVPQPPPPAPPAPVESTEPGEFTRIFQAPKIAPPAATQEPGEFTRMFGLSNNPVPPAVKSERSRIEAKPAAPASEPGEFTQMFGRTNPNPPPADVAPKSTTESGEPTRIFKGPQRPTPPPPPLAAQQPSEFTKLFNNPMPETPLAERLDKPQFEAKPAAQFSDPGDFSKMFGRPNQDSTAPAAISNPFSAADGVTGIFSNRNKFESALPQASMAAGPSEYTKIFQPGTRPSETAADSIPAGKEQKPPAPPPQPSAKKEKPAIPIALIVVLAAIALVAVALILYFAIKR